MLKQVKVHEDEELKVVRHGDVVGVYAKGDSDRLVGTFFVDSELPDPDERARAAFHLKFKENFEEVGETVDMSETDRELIRDVIDKVYGGIFRMNDETHIPLYKLRAWRDGHTPDGWHHHRNVLSFILRQKAQEIEALINRVER